MPHCDHQSLHYDAQPAAHRMYMVELEVVRSILFHVHSEQRSARICYHVHHDWHARNVGNTPLRNLTRTFLPGTAHFREDISSSVPGDNIREERR